MTKTLFWALWGDQVIEGAQFLPSNNVHISVKCPQILKTDSQQVQNKKFHTREIDKGGKLSN